jgi:ABC-type transport system involved in cytochrome c biogenesis permease subunit
MKNLKRKTALLSIVVTGFILFGCVSQSHAEVSSLDELSRMVILENGRKKPLDTFAQNILKQFSGRDRFEGKPAIQWLARVLFDPEQSHNDKVFLVTNPEVLDSIGITRVGKARNRYSFLQLNSGINRLRQLAFNVSKIDNKDRSFIENEIISLYNSLYFYRQLTDSLSFLSPSSEFTVNDAETRHSVGLPADRTRFSFLELAAVKGKIDAFIASFKDKERAEWSDSEREIFSITESMNQWASHYRDLPLTVMPGMRQEKESDEKWLSPWDMLISSYFHGSSPAGELFLLQDAAVGYWENRQDDFDTALAAFNHSIREKAGDRIRERAVSLEVFYNRLDSFYKAKFFYGFSVLFLLLSFIAVKKWFYRLSFFLLGVGFLLHLLGVAARMYIMQRPPVTNLYETFIFTGLITALLGMVLELFNKRNLGILTGSLAGLIMLMIAGKYALEGDTMGMLVAVLDSNFWLASHVITIILGYSGVVLSGLIGHVYILQKIFRPHKTDILQNTFQAVYAIQAFGLIFTFLGTVLGGIWADQSWGRFWGWDPKENGALLILLLSALLFHARLAGWIKETGMAFGTVIGVIAVSLAWFGVNLLGVGLHSYGFTSGVARSLFLFITFELLFMIVTGIMLSSGKISGADKA